MKPLIINLRGNSGSGKTYTTRAFMAAGNFQATQRVWKEGERPKTDYLGTLKGSKRPWVVLGSYENACGGCDTIHTYDEIMQRVTHYTKANYNVWLEGLMMSDTYGSIGEFSKQFGNRWVYCYLLPPLEVCLKRVQQRRDEAGNDKPFNPRKTTSRHATILRSAERVHQEGHLVMEVPWENPLPALLKYIRKEAK